MIKEIVSQLRDNLKLIEAFEPKEDFDRAVKTSLLENLNFTLDFSPENANRFPTYREEVFDASNSLKTLRQLFYAGTDPDGSWTGNNILANKYPEIWTYINDTNYYYRELFKMVRDGDEIFGITPEG